MPAAAAIPAVISAAGAVAGAVGSGMQAAAAGDAAASQIEAAEQAAKIQKQQYRDDISYSWPWYSGGVAAQNQLLNLMGLGSATTADTATGTAGGYADPATAMMEAERIRTGIKDQIQGSRHGEPVQNALYNLEGIKNPQKILNRMTDLELYRTFGPNGQYRNAAAAGGTGAASTIPADTSQAGLQQNALQMFQTDPGYQFRLQEAEKAILRNAAATGGAQGGATQKALTRYAQDYGSNEYANYFNRLAALAGRGQTQTANNQQLGYNTASAIGGNTLAAGQARASGYVNQGNAWANGLNNLGQGLGSMASAFGGMAGGGGGGNYGGWGSGGFPYSFGG